MSEREPTFIERCRALLEERWGYWVERAQSTPDITIPEHVTEAIGRSIQSTIKTYRYVLPTQLLAKSVKATLDCRSIQGGAELEGAFDARSLCHSVIVPFDRANHNVLGGSTEPYVNNPLRIASISSQYRAAQKNKRGFDDLCAVLDYAEGSPDMVGALFDCVLIRIKERLQTVHIVYGTPNRVSLKQTMVCIRNFTSVRSGGVRLQSVASALFATIGSVMRLYERVEGADVNAADASTGSVADLECISTEGEVIFAVEVKDRTLTLRHLQDKLPAARAKGITELFFLVNGGIEPGELEGVHATIDREFVTGQNLYVCEFEVFLESCLALFGEGGRRDFLQRVGESLDQHADLSQRMAWRDILEIL